jgi:hypothetical protein
VQGSGSLWRDIVVRVEDKTTSARRLENLPFGIPFMPLASSAQRNLCRQTPPKRKRHGILC